MISFVLVNHNTNLYSWQAGKIYAFFIECLFPFFVWITNFLKYAFYCMIMCNLHHLFMSSSSRASCVSYVLFCIIFNYTTILGRHLENHFVTSTSFKFVNTRLNLPLIWICTTIQELKASNFLEWDWWQWISIGIYYGYILDL